MASPHIDRIRYLQEGAEEFCHREASPDAKVNAVALEAQTEATLALAYEQRTANLIALLNLGYEAITAITDLAKMEHTDWQKVAVAIHKRLGL